MLSDTPKVGDSSVTSLSALRSPFQVTQVLQNVSVPWGIFAVPQGILQLELCRPSQSLFPKTRDLWLLPEPSWGVLDAQVKVLPWVMPTQAAVPWGAGYECLPAGCSQLGAQPWGLSLCFGARGICPAGRLNWGCQGWHCPAHAGCAGTSSGFVPHRLSCSCC